MKAWYSFNNNIIEKEVELKNQEDKVLIRIKAFGLNRADLGQIQGGYMPPKGVTDILGLEFSGVVEKSIQKGLFKEGDRVMGLVQGGAYAEYIYVEEDLLIKIPDTINFVQAAVLPEAWCTVLLNLKEIGNIKKNQRILLHSATGSVGPVAIQYAKYCGCYVIATTRSEEKLEFLKSIGADFALLSSELIDSVDDIKKEGGIDFILDPVGKDTFKINQHLLNLDGKMVYIGVMSGKDSLIDLSLLLMKRQQVIGSTLRSQPLYIRKRLMDGLKSMLLYIISSNLFLPIAKVFKWEETYKALEFMKENKNKGKIIVEL